MVPILRYSPVAIIPKLLHGVAPVFSGLLSIRAHLSAPKFLDICPADIYMAPFTWWQTGNAMVNETVAPDGLWLALCF